jgi:hypothetical protein
MRLLRRPTSYVSLGMPQLADHDFAPETTLTPVGIFLHTLGELLVDRVTSKTLGVK